MILLTCPRCHKADDDCQCWPLVTEAPLKNQIVDMSLAGMAPGHIAHRLNCNLDWVFEIRAELSLTLPKKKPKIIALLEAGKRTGEILRVVGCGRDWFKEVRKEVGIVGRRRRRARPGKFLSVQEVERRWGLPLHQLLSDLAEQDFSMRQAADALGCNRETLRAYAASMDRSPWAPRDVAATWEQQTGETITAAARRLAETHTVSQAARALGYYNCSGLLKALRVRGVTVQFQRA